MLIRLFISKRIQFVKNTSLDLICVLRIDISNSFTASGSMPLQIKSSVGESVTIRTRRLEDWLNVAYVAYMVVVSQWSQSFWCFCKLRLAISPITFAITISKYIAKYRELEGPQLKVYPLCATLWNWLAQPLSILLMMKLKYLKYLLPIFYFRGNGEQKHEKSPLYGCLVFLTRWHSWLCRISLGFWVKQLPCNP